MAELRERLIPFPCMRAGMRSCGEVRRPTYGVMMRRPVERTGTEREINACVRAHACVPWWCLEVLPFSFSPAGGWPLLVLPRAREERNVRRSIYLVSVIPLAFTTASDNRSYHSREILRAISSSLHAYSRPFMAKLRSQRFARSPYARHVDEHCNGRPGSMRHARAVEIEA